MISESDALERILERVAPALPVAAALVDAHGAYSGANVQATVPVPGFDNSAMDGYAVRSGDCSEGVPLRIVGTQPAGRDLGLSLSEGEAIRIFTGAPMPSGADAVVMQEDTTCSDAARGEVTINTGDVQLGEFVRRRGADLCGGQTILRKGEKLHSARIGLLASQGLGSVAVGGRPRVTVISTGDELAQAGEKLEGGELYNSNGPMLAALARECGLTDVNALHLRDDPEEMKRVLGQEIAKGGFLVISGGVSVGERDFVKEVLESEGVTTDFWRVCVKPGKPLLFGHSEQHGTMVFGLPGNPVSSFVTFCLFVRPAMIKSQGAARDFWEMPVRSCVCLDTLKNSGPRPHYIRGSMQWRLLEKEGQGHWTDEAAAEGGRQLCFEPATLQESHGLRSLAESDALLRVAEGEVVHKGERVNVRCAFSIESF